MVKINHLIRFLSHPNNLTLFRIALVPAIVFLLYFPNRLSTLLAAVLFGAAAVTDFLDGYYARERGQVSSLGKIMDPIADKLIVSAAFIMLTSLGWIQAWIACVIIGREFAVTGLRNMIAESNQDVSASILGKFKTGFQIAAIIPLLIHYPYFGVDFNSIGQILLWCALVLTVWSGIDYFVRHWKLFEA